MKRYSKIYLILDNNLTEIACLIVNTDYGYEYIIISSFIIVILFYPYSMYPIPIIATFVKNQDFFSSHMKNK